MSLGMLWDDNFRGRDWLLPELEHRRENRLMQRQLASQQPRANLFFDFSREYVTN